MWTRFMRIYKWRYITPWDQDLTIPKHHHRQISCQPGNKNRLVLPSDTCTYKHKQFYIDQTGINIMNLKFYPVASSKKYIVWTYKFFDRVAMYKLVNQNQKGKMFYKFAWLTMSVYCVHKHVYILEGEYEHGTKMTWQDTQIQKISY